MTSADVCSGFVDWATEAATGVSSNSVFCSPITVRISFVVCRILTISGVGTLAFGSIGFAVPANLDFLFGGPGSGACENEGFILVKSSSVVVFSVFVSDESFGTCIDSNTFDEVVFLCLAVLSNAVRFGSLVLVIELAVTPVNILVVKLVVALGTGFGRGLVLDMEPVEDEIRVEVTLEVKDDLSLEMNSSNETSGSSTVLSSTSLAEKIKFSSSCSWSWG